MKRIYKETIKSLQKDLDVLIEKIEKSPITNIVGNIVEYQPIGGMYNDEHYETVCSIRDKVQELFLNNQKDFMKYYSKQYTEFICAVSEYTQLHVINKLLVENYTGSDNLNDIVISESLMIEVYKSHHVNLSVASIIESIQFDNVKSDGYVKSDATLVLDDNNVAFYIDKLGEFVKESDSNKLLLNVNIDISSDSECPLLDNTLMPMRQITLGCVVNRDKPFTYNDIHAKVKHAVLDYITTVLNKRDILEYIKHELSPVRKKKGKYKEPRLLEITRQTCDDTFVDTIADGNISDIEVYLC